MMDDRTGAVYLVRVLRRRLFAVAALGFSLHAAAAAPPCADPNVTRFLEQATFGPTPSLCASIQQVGLAAWLEEQFALPLPAYPDLVTPPELGGTGCPGTGYCPQNAPADCVGTCRRNNYTMYLLQRRYFERALTAPDQLRQRVAFALNQIVVVSATDNDLRLSQRMLPYLAVLDRNAFGNFRDLLRSITLNPAMGRFLDTVNNRRTAPNENYAREILQLFAIGVDRLNQDGTPQLDASGQRIPTYTQETVANFARVFTGWVFAPQPVPGIPNYFVPMVPGGPNAHDTNPKTLLDGFEIPGGGNAATDLERALDNIFNHPNVGPFIGKHLIKHLVTSNPSPGYVARVAAAFAANEAGVRGDMKAVIRQILLDPEARNPAPDPSFGRLREPVLWITNLLRRFGASAATTDFVLADRFLPADLHMGQDLFYAPSVFNFFPADYVIPGEDLFGPEFAIHSTTTALARTHFACAVIFHTAPCVMPVTANRPMGTVLDLAPLEPLAVDPVELVEYLNSLMLHGTMTLEMSATLIDAIAAIPNTAPDYLPRRVKEAVYLVATSPQFLVQR